MPNVTTTTAGYLNVTDTSSINTTDASTLNITTTERSTVAHIDPNCAQTAVTEYDIVFRGDRGDVVPGYLEPLLRTDLDCDDILLERLWKEKVKPYLDNHILARVTEEELRSVLKLGGDP